METASALHSGVSAAAMAASPSSPIKSEIFTAIALLTMSIVVLFIIRHYLPLRTTPAYLLVPVFLALWLPVSIVLLVPVDLASSARAEDVDARGIWLGRRTLLVSWRITYWLTFALTWLILPVLGEYSDSGYREPQAKILDSLRANAQYYAAVFASATLGLIYVLVSYGHFSSSLKSTVMALAYCWGLVLAIYLLGHGLVAIPRRLFRSASIRDRLKQIQAQAPRVFDNMEEADVKLEELKLQVAELSRRKGGSAKPFQEWIEDLEDLTKLPEIHSRSSLARDVEAEVQRLPTVITEKYMADLTRMLVRARHARSRHANEWKRLLQDAVKTQQILDSAVSKKLELGNASPHAGMWEKLTILTPYTRHLLHYHVMPYIRLLLGGILALASVCIIWSEVVKGLLPNLSIIRYSVIHHWQPDGTGQVGFAGQVVTVVWMCYMCAAALISITEVKVWRGRALVRRNTAPESAFWYASQVARLSIPLSYNFMTFLGSNVYRRTMFYDFLGQLISLTPLGTWFDYLFPMFILFPVCATLFAWYARVCRIFGFGADMLSDEDESSGGGAWRTGRDLIARELNGVSATFRDRSAEAAARIIAASSPSNIPYGRASVSCGQPSTPLGTSPGERLAANTSARRAPLVGEEREDDGILDNIGHRFKNAVEGLGAPTWLQEIRHGIKKPRWIGGDEGAESSGGHGSGLRRWFSGREDMRIRL